MIATKQFKQLILRVFFVFALQVFFVGIASFSSKAYAAINETINIEGKLVNNDGTNATASCLATNICDFRLRLYSAQSGGTLLWEETQSNKTVTNGIFSLKMGSVTSLATSSLQNFDRNDLWVQIEFDPSGNGDFAENEIFSRSQLATVPYAMNSKYLNGFQASDFIKSSATTTFTGGLVLATGTPLTLNGFATGSVLFVNSSGQIISDPTNFYWDNTNKRLGIGVNNPDATLTVLNNQVIRRVGTTTSQLLFSNTAGTGDFKIAGDGNDIYWQGGGGRALQMG
jgi:hypothetical protein